MTWREGEREEGEGGEGQEYMTIVGTERATTHNPLSLSVVTCFKFIVTLPVFTGHFLVGF